LRNVATRKAAFLGKTFWLHTVGESGSDWRCGKAWEVSLAEAVAESQSLNPLSPTIVASFQSIATTLKPFSPSLKAFYVADKPVESDEPKGEQKPKGSPQRFRENDQTFSHCRSPAPQSLA
jgi:hypothetical protein